MKKLFVIIASLFIGAAAFAESGKYDGYTYFVNYCGNEISEDKMIDWANGFMAEGSQYCSSMGAIKLTSRQMEVLKYAVGQYDSASAGDIYNVIIGDPDTDSSIICIWVHYPDNNGYSYWAFKIVF